MFSVHTHCDKPHHKEKGALSVREKTQRNESLKRISQIVLVTTLAACFADENETIAPARPANPEIQGLTSYSDEKKLGLGLYYAKGMRIQFTTHLSADISDKSIYTSLGEEDVEGLEFSFNSPITGEIFIIEKAFNIVTNKEMPIGIPSEEGGIKGATEWHIPKGFGQ